jgi:DNA-binding protein HU-beta
MNKSEFIKYIAAMHACTQIAISALSDGSEISLVGFGNFSVSKVAARAGRNPSTGEAIEISARNQVKFKVGKTLKDAVNDK